MISVEDVCVLDFAMVLWAIHALKSGPGEIGLEVLIGHLFRVVLPPEVSSRLL
jgi:hypothetical protein